MIQPIEYCPLLLKHGEDARLRDGHLWVFSNEVDVARSPLDSFEPGAACRIMAANGKPLGLGYANPHSLICARLMTRRMDQPLDARLLADRIRTALALRERLYAEPYYRLLYGESDGVPGLTLDRYGEVIVAQATTAGIERLKADVAAAVREVLQPRAVIWKNDAGIRELEGLEAYVEAGLGELPETLEVREGGIDFTVNATGGQKTGWFYDQRANRDELMPWVKGRRVLDMFAYLGAWGLRAARMGATEVVCVDASAPAVECIRDNARRNDLAERVRAERADAFDYLKTLREQHACFDVVILDPPAFIKRRKDFKQGALAYRRINELAMQVLAPDGILVTCSCSHHLPRAALLDAVRRGAGRLGRGVQLIRQLQQAPDHAVHPAIPETDYLKGFICRVLPA